MLTADRVRELFNYDPVAGLLLRRVKTSSRTKVGEAAGNDSGRGYLRVEIDTKSYYVHRVIWLYVTGQWPVGDIDHKDGNRSNNRWTNLREVTRAVNCQNRRKAHINNKSSGLLGVSKVNGKWYAHICANKKNMLIGRFDTAEEAHAAYLAKKRELHPGCTI